MQSEGLRRDPTFDNRRLDSGVKPRDGFVLSRETLDRQSLLNGRDGRVLLRESYISRIGDERQAVTPKRREEVEHRNNKRFLRSEKRAGRVNRDENSSDPALERLGRQSFEELPSLLRRFPFVKIASDV